MQVLSLPMVTQQSHTHGEINANIMIEKDIIKIELIMPAETAIGFEHAPKTPSENKAIELFKSYAIASNFFNFFTSSQLFKKQKVTTIITQSNAVLNGIEQKNKQPHLHEHKHHKPLQIPGHLEFVVTKTLRIKEPQLIHSMKINLFDKLPNIESVKLIVINNGKTFHHHLSKNRSKISFN